MRNTTKMPSIFIDAVEDRTKYESLQIGLSFFHGNANFALASETEKDEVSIQMKTMQKVSKAGDIPLMYNVKTRVKYKMALNGASLEIVGEYSLIINTNRSINLIQKGSNFHTDYRQVIDFVANEVLHKMLSNNQQSVIGMGLSPNTIHMPAEKVLEEAKSKLVIGLFSKEIDQNRQSIVQNLVA